MQLHCTCSMSIHPPIFIDLTSIVKSSGDLIVKSFYWSYSKELFLLDLLVQSTLYRLSSYSGVIRSPHIICRVWVPNDLYLYSTQYCTSILFVMLSFSRIENSRWLSVSLRKQRIYIPITSISMLWSKSQCTENLHTDYKYINALIQIPMYSYYTTYNIQYTVIQYTVTPILNSGFKFYKHQLHNK